MGIKIVTKPEMLCDECGEEIKEGGLIVLGNIYVIEVDENFPEQFSENSFSSTMLVGDNIPNYPDGREVPRSTTKDFSFRRKELKTSCYHCDCLVKRLKSCG